MNKFQKHLIDCLKTNIRIFLFLFSTTVYISSTSLMVDSEPYLQNQLDTCAKYVISNPRKVITIAEHLTDNKNKIADTDITGMAYYYLGAAYHQLKEPDHAVYHFSKSVDEFLESKNMLWLGKAYINLGIVHRNQGQFESAIKYMAKATDIFTELQESEKLVEIRMLSGSIYAKQEKYEDAISELNQAIALAKSISNDTLHAKSYAHLTLLHRDKGSFEEALNNEMKACDLYQVLNDSISLAASFNMQGSILWRMNKFPEAEKAYIKAVEMRESLNQPIQQAKSLENLARVYKDWHYVHKADSTTQQAIRLYQAENDSLGVASAFNNLGNIYFEKNNLVKALHCYLKALMTYEEVGNNNGIITIQKNIANIYQSIGEYKKSLEYYHIALEKEVNEKNSSGAAYVENLIGSCHLNLKNLDSALLYYNKALKKYQDLQHDKNQALTLNLIGNAYFHQKNYNKALTYYESSADYGHSAQDMWRVATQWNNIGNVYFELQQLDKALHAFQKAYILNTKIENIYGIALCSRKIGEIYKQRASSDSTVYYLKKSLELGNKIDHKELVKNASYDLYDYYNSKNDHKNALLHYRNYSIISDSIEKETNSQHIAEIQLSQIILEKEDLINEYLSDREMLIADNVSKNMQLLKQKSVQNLLITGIIASLAILFLVINRYRLKRNHARELNEQIKIIKDTNIALADSEAELLSLNTTKDKFFSVLAHDLRNPLTGIVTASNTLQNNYEQFGDEQKRGFIEIINASARQLENLLTNLLFWTRSQTGRTTVNPVSFNLKSIVDDIIELSKINADKKNIQLNHNLTGTETIFADKEMITTVIRNLVGNAIKFTRPEGSVTIDAEMSEDTYKIAVTDTGVGISPGNLRKLFRFDQKISTYGTDDEAGSGLGLILSKDFVEKNGGNIWVERTSNLGTTLKFTVPKS